MDDEFQGGGARLRLSAFLPYRLSVLSNTISAAIAEDYEREFGLNIWQWRVMAVLGEEPGLTARGVAERTAMDKVAVSRAVSGLEGMDLLKRSSHPSDARAMRLSLTRTGQVIYGKIAEVALSHERRLLAALSDREREVLQGLLAKLAKSARQDRALWLD